MAPKFRELFELLERHGVKYVVIGGAAMVLQGSSYITEDVDVLYERSPENCRCLAEALGSISPRLRVEGTTESLAAPIDAPSIRAGMNFTFTTALGDFDIFGEVPGVGKYDSAVALADEYELIEGYATKVLSISGLIKAKRAAGRPKDLAAIPELEAMEELRNRSGR